MCDKQFWDNPQLFNLLTNSVFSYLDAMDNKDVKMLLNHFMHPFVLKCPQNLYDTLLTQVLVPLCASLNKRIDNAWNMSVNRERSSNASDDVLRLDVIQDKVLTELTREVLQLPTDVTQCLNRSKEVTNPKPNALCQFILNNENIMGMWLMIAIRTLVIPDSLTVQKSITLLQRVLPLLVQKDKFDVLLSGDLLQMSIRSLMLHKADMHQNLTNLICDIYTLYVHRSTSLPKQIFSQIPNVTDKKIANLNKELQKAGGGGNKTKVKDSVKKQRALMKKFLAPIAGKQSGEFKKTVSIVSINSGSGVNRRRKGNNQQSSFLDDVAVNTAYLGQLFK
jgi:hypothetical protein